MPRRLLILLAALVAACHPVPPEPVADGGPEVPREVDSGPETGSSPRADAVPESALAQKARAVTAQKARRQEQIRRRSKPSANGKLADPRVTECMRTATDSWQSLRGCLGSIAAPTIDAGTLKLAALSSPVPESNTSWLVPHWEWNVSTGSDNATGVDSSHPLQHESELWKRWGTRNPILLQATEIVEQVNDATESIILDPIIGPGGSITFLSPTTTVLTGNLGTVTPKNRSRGGSGTFACPSATLCPFLQATWAGISSAHAGDMIVNSMHPGVAWVKAVSGSVAILTQPFVANVPAFTTFPAEVDTWTTGDAFSLVTPKQVQIASINPTIATGDSSGDSYFCFVGNVWATDPSGTIGESYGNVSRLCRITESRIDPYYAPASVSPGFDGTLQNSLFLGAGLFTHVDIQGGGYGTAASSSVVFSGIVDGDTIFDTNTIIEQDNLNVSNIVGYAGFNNVTSTGGVQIDGDTALVGDAYGGIGAIYGKAIFTQVSTSASFGWLDTAANTFLGSMSPNCQLAAFANAVDRTVNPEQWYGPRALTIAALDLSVAAGGFGGAAYCDSGATFHNLVQSSAAPGTWVNDVGHGGTGHDAGCATGTLLEGQGATSAAACESVVTQAQGGVALPSGCSTGQAIGENPFHCFTPSGTGVSCPINLASCVTGSLALSSIAPCSNGQFIETVSGVQTCASIGSFPSNSVSNGFTGQTSGTAHALVSWEGTSPLGTIGPCSTGQTVLGNTGADPSCGALPYSSLTGVPSNSVANGLTGATSFAAHSILLGEGTSPIGTVGPSTNNGFPVVSTGAGSDPVYAQVALNGGTQGVTGDLQVVNGGLGVTTLSSGGLVVGAGTSAVTTLAPGTAGNVAQSNGSVWTSAPIAAPFDAYAVWSGGDITVGTGGTTVVTTTIVSRAGHLLIDAQVPEVTQGPGNSAPGITIQVFVGSTPEVSWGANPDPVSNIPRAGGGWSGWIAVPATTVTVQLVATTTVNTAGVDAFLRILSYGF